MEIRLRLSHIWPLFGREKISDNFTLILWKNHF